MLIYGLYNGNTHLKNRFQNLIFSSLFTFKNTDSASAIALREWRTRILDGILRGVFVLWLIALAGGIGNVLDAYRHESHLYENPLAMASAIIAFYLGTTAILAYISFNRKLKFEWRAGLLLFIFYTLGTIGMALSSFSGDGRIFFFAFIILSTVFFDLRYSLTAFIFTFLTLVLLGWLQVSEILVVPAERQVNSTDVGAWVSGGMVLLLLSIAALISITYLLRVLEKSLAGMRTSLEREQRLSQILRTVSEINQLIVRAQEPEKMLNEACALLVAGQGYDFAWVGLLAADNVSIRLAAYAGDVVDESKFNFHMNEKAYNLACAEQAIRTRTFFRVNPVGSEDPCANCPRRSKYPNRSAVAFPLLRDDRALGVLIVDHVKPSAVFDGQEIALLQELTDDLAYALEKLEMDNRLLINAHFKTLLTDVISIALETTDSSSLLQSTADRMRDVYNANACYILLWDEIQQAPVPAAASGFSKEIFLQLQPTSDEIQMADSLFRAGETLIAEDADSDPRVSRRVVEYLSIRSVLGIPLLAGGKRQGGIFLTYNKPYHFTQEEILFGEQVAGHVALALERSRLHDETQAKAAELERLYAAAQDMAASIMDPPELLAKLARHMTEALEVTSGNIVAVNLDDATMQVVGEHWSDNASSAEARSDLGRVYSNIEYETIITAMRNGRVIVMHSDDERMTLSEREQFFEYGIKSMMFVPIMAHGQLFGDIELWESRRRREFTQAEIRLAKAMAGHAASIIENLNLVNALRSSETRYRTLVEQASDGIFLANSERRYVDVNPSGCAMLGYSRDEILSMRMEDLTFSDELSVTPFRMDDLRAGKTLIVERLLKRKDGSPIPVEISARMLPNGYLQGITRDISERKRAEKALAEREAYFRALIENSAEGVAIIDAQGMTRYLAPSEERLTGYTPEEIVGQSAFQYIHPQDLPKVLKTFSEGVATPGAVRSVDYRLQRKDGEWRYFEIIGHNMLDDPHIAGVVVNYRDVTARKQAEQALQESRSRLEAIISTAFNGIITIDSDQKIVLFNPSAERIFGYLAAEVIGQPLDKLIPNRYHHSHSKYVEQYGHTGITSRKKGQLDSLYGKRANGEEFPLEAFISFSEVDGKKLFTVIFQDITERKQAEEALRESERKFRALAENIPSAVYQCKNDSRYSFMYLNDSIEALTGYPKSVFMDGGLSFVDLYHPEDRASIPIPTPLNEHEINRNPFHITYRIKHRTGRWVWVDEWGTGVLDAHGNVQYLEGVMIDITERKRAEENLKRHALELETLAAASSSLRTAQDLKEMAPILALHALRAVNGTYASIFLLEPETGDFVSRGWYSASAPLQDQLPLEASLRHLPGEGITGRVAETGKIYITEDIQEDPVLMVLEGERELFNDVRGGISLPLRAQEKIIGVMHIWSAEPRIFNETDTRLLTALAETAGNAIHRAILFEQTLEQADELSKAYDNTLAGWARALELRDELTEGHTRRVTELTLQLARALNIPENELVHIRRGALLHDIGKMGIPDSILHKPGPFTAQERKIMQQHTQYAYDMLSSIPFLQAALDIPFCHHEHWNGAGYPRGLKGEEIPLSARIFSVVDVWDALTSDRPYRQAWSRETTTAYILERAGEQFDPRIVEAFFSLGIDQD